MIWGWWRQNTSFKERLMERKRPEIRVRCFRDQEKGIEGKLKISSGWQEVRKKFWKETGKVLLWDIYCFICPVFSAPLPLASSTFWGPGSEGGCYKEKILMSADWPNGEVGWGRGGGSENPTAPPRVAGDVCISVAQYLVFRSLLHVGKQCSRWLRGRVRGKGKKLGWVGFRNNQSCQGSKLKVRSIKTWRG